MSANPSGAVHPNRFLIAWAIATVALGRLWPGSLPEWHPMVGVGTLLAVLGGILLAWAQYEFWKHNTTDSHSKPTTTLVTGGPFRFSRHPVYVGLVLLMTGLAVRYSNPWGVLLVVLFLLFVQRFTVVPEEAYLERTFGDAYREYCGAVRRWL